MHELSKVGRWGAFIGGMLYVSSFTVAIGVLLLVSATESVPLIPLSLLAGLGGVIGDTVIFKFIRSSLRAELIYVYEKLGGRFITKLFKRHKPLSSLLPVLGAIMIASPLPDEIGVSIMGVSRMRTIHFMIMTAFLNSVGVYVLLAFSQQIL